MVAVHCGLTKAARSTAFSLRPRSRAARSRLIFEDRVSLREASKPAVHGEDGRSALAQCTVNVADRRRWSAAAPFMEGNSSKLMF